MWDVRIGDDMIFYPSYDYKGPRAREISRWNNDANKWEFVGGWCHCTRCEESK